MKRARDVDVDPSIIQELEEVVKALKNPAPDRKRPRLTWVDPDAITREMERADATRVASRIPA